MLNFTGFFTSPPSPNGEIIASSPFLHKLSKCFSVKPSTTEERQNKAKYLA